MNEMRITQIYVIIAYLLADRQQRILKSIKYTYSVAFFTVHAKTQLNTCVKC